MFKLQNCNFTQSDSIMIIFWKFFKLLESIIFRNFSICVEKLHYIKNYMKTRRETRKGRLPSPIFVLRNRTEHLYYTRNKECWVWKNYQNIFKTRPRPWQLKISLRKKPTIFYSFGVFSIYYVFTEEFYSLHPTITVKIWKFSF